MRFDDNLNLEATELRLGLPGTTTTTTTTTNPQDNEDPEKQTSSKSNKRSLLDMNEESTESREHSNVLNHKKGRQETAPPSKTQVVGWPPIRSYRKNCLQERKIEAEAARMYVKVSMDGAPFLRKIDLKDYKGYSDLLTALEDMFKFKIGKYFGGEGYNGPDYAPTYEDKEGDWMLVGDVPWDMFIISCKRLRIMKGSEARGLGCVV